MRGDFQDQSGLFLYVSPNSRIPKEYPLRRIRQLVRDVLNDLSPNLGRLCAREGRPSVPPEQLLSALLLQVFYGIRSERQLIEQLNYNLLYRWFVAWHRMIRYGIPRHLPRTASACRVAMSSRNS
jgi:transposase